MSMEISNSTSTPAVATQVSGTNQVQSQVSQKLAPTNTDSFVASKPKNDLALYGNGGKTFGAAGQTVNSEAVMQTDSTRMDDEMEAARIHQQRIMHEVQLADFDSKRMQYDQELALMDAQRIQQED